MPPSIAIATPVLGGPGTMRARRALYWRVVLNSNRKMKRASPREHVALCARALDARRSLLQLATNPLQSIFAVTLLCTLVLHRLWCAYTRMDKAQ